MRLEEEGITTALAPYEIQMRLIFETDERVMVSCRGISPVPRYAAYADEVDRRIAAGMSFALIVRKDSFYYNFGRRHVPRSARFMAIEKAASSMRPLPIDSDEFLVFYPLNAWNVGSAAPDNR